MNENATPRPSAARPLVTAGRPPAADTVRCPTDEVLIPAIADLDVVESLLAMVRERGRSDRLEQAFAVALKRRRSELHDRILAALAP